MKPINIAAQGRFRTTSKSLEQPPFWGQLRVALAEC
jgi:hypothetical protein